MIHPWYNPVPKRYSNAVLVDELFGSTGPLLKDSSVYKEWRPGVPHDQDTDSERDNKETPHN